MNDPKQTELLGMDLPELTALAEQAQQPPYRGRQLFEAIYRQRIDRFEHISTLPEAFRSVLSNRGLRVGIPRIENANALFQTFYGLVQLAPKRVWKLGYHAEARWRGEEEGQMTNPVFQFLSAHPRVSARGVFGFALSTRPLTARRRRVRGVGTRDAG